jgi:hypothetical protein
MPRPPVIIARTLLIVAVIAFIIPQLSFFNEGLQTFGARWEQATGKDTESFKTNIVDRAVDDMLPPLDFILDADSLLGRGVGYGTPMAAAYLSGGQRGFSLAESEWPRLLLEMGPVLGLGFIMLRVALCGLLIARSVAALHRGNVLPVLICSSSVLVVLNGSWGQATNLGFATFAAGLTLAAVTLPADQATVRPRPVRRKPKPWSPSSRQPWKPLGVPEPVAPSPQAEPS